MEKRIAAAIIIIENTDNISVFNNLLSLFSSVIIARQGIPLKDRGFNIVSLILEATLEEINSLSGKIGRLDGVKIKTIITK